MINEEFILASEFLLRSLPGVNAPTAEAQGFAQIWRSLTGQSYKLKMAVLA
ncbi:MAG: hypothetical protein IGS49_09725 [Chlorogloeopsis fritschii C42_A2020_084]|uniref:hypothetical protein n=1 Tax=Chlorogloeopsis fritschii TaxID=1124 RepID=UPI001A06411E|nr:hypothetical protein [Chlorogloeopsis fritschii]MBF2005724.1 hypothetical protein [Chlorogloeopsis fritschii C42_A2020_084]